MRGQGVALAVSIGIAAAGLGARSACAEESWYSVERSDHRDWNFSLSGGFALLDIEGDGTFDPDSVDTEFDFDSTLGVSDIDTMWAEIDLQLVEGTHLRFAFNPQRFDGSEPLATPIVVDSVVYGAGDVVDTDLKLDSYDVSLRGDFWLGEYVSIAPLVQLSLVDAKLKLVNVTDNRRVDEEVLVPLPYLGLRTEVYPLARLGLIAEGKGMILGAGNSTWDVSGGLSLHLTPNASLTGRYRLSHYHVEFDSEIDVDLSGPQLGATVRF